MFKFLTRLLVSIALVLTSLPAMSDHSAVIIYAANMPEIANVKEGSYGQLATVVSEYRSQPSHVYFLFGGASLGPSPFSSLDRGSHIIDLLNTLEPDAMAVSEREFSYFEDELSLRAYEAAFPLVSSNLYDPLTGGNLDGIVSSALLVNDGFAVGVISIIDSSVIEEYALKRIQVTDPQKAVVKQTEQLRKQGASLVILMYSGEHAFIDQLLAEGKLDLALYKNELAGDKVKAMSNLHPNNVFLSESEQFAVVSFDHLRSANIKVKIEIRNLNEVEADDVVTAQEHGYTLRLNKLLAYTIGKTQVALDTRAYSVRTRENAFANFLTDTMKGHTGAEVAVINGGTIRGNLQVPAGSALTRKDLARILPFRNSIVLINVTGAQILQALENGLSQLDEVKGRYLQLSGMTLKYDSSLPAGERVVEVKINDEPLETARYYKLATSDYLARGGDGYTMFAEAEQLNYSKQMSRLTLDLVVEKIMQDEFIAPLIEGRVVDVSL